MSRPTSPLLDGDWELNLVQSGVGSPLLSDDELDTFSLSLSETPSDIGDDPWEGLDADNGSDRYRRRVSSAIQRTPSQTARLLIEAVNDTQELTLDENSTSTSDSAFSYRWPDPLSTSTLEDEATLPPEHVSDDSEIELSDAETTSVLALTSSLDQLERSSTLLLPPTRPAPSPVSPRYTMFYATGLAVVAVAVGCLAQSYRTSDNVLIKFTRDPDTASVETTFWANVILHPIIGTNFPTSTPVGTAGASAADDTIVTLPAISIPPAAATATGRALLGSSSKQACDRPHRSITVDEDSSSGFFTRSPSGLPSTTFSTDEKDLQMMALLPFTRITKSLTISFQTFSRIILKDLQDVLAIMDELFQLFRAVAFEHSRSVIGIVAQKVGERHQRAKQNAKKLKKAGMELVKVASYEVADNARSIWAGMRKEVSRLAVEHVRHLDEKYPPSGGGDNALRAALKGTLQSLI